MTTKKTNQQTSKQEAKTRYK